MILNEEKQRFSAICSRLLCEERARCGIGTYNEKLLHSILKLFVCEDKRFHEQRVYPVVSGNEDIRDGSYVADVLCGTEIYEIQTGSLFPLKKKIRYYMEKTTYNVTVIVPLAAQKRIVWVNPETSEASKAVRSPKKQTGRDIIPELFWLVPYLSDARLSVRVMLLEINEYRLRDGWGNDGKRGAHRIERVPVSLIDIIDLNGREDIRPLLPEGLQNPFTAADFGKATRWRGRKVYSAIKVFLSLGLIRPGEKRGRAQSYIVI